MLIHDPETGLAVALALGVACVAASERLRVPAIITLLIAGLAVGPFLDLFDPDAL